MFSLRNPLVRVLLQLGIVLVAALLPLLAAEVYFRVRYDSQPSLADDQGLDRDVGWDRTPPLVPLPGNAEKPLKIYFLGDSFVDGKLWPQYAQEQTAARGVSFDGFSLGVSGHGTTQQLLKLQKLFEEERPEVVVLLMYAWNDLRDNIRTPSIFYSPMLMSRPYYVPSDSGFTLTHHSPGFLSTILAHSEVYTRIIQRTILKFNTETAKKDINQIVEHKRPLQLLYDEPVSWEPFYNPTKQNDAYVRLAYDVTAHNLRLLKDFVAAQGSTLVVLSLDNPFTVDQDVADLYITDTAHFDPLLPQQRLRTIVTDLQVPYMSATPALRAEQKRIGKKIYNGPAGNIGAHLEPEGERVMGKLAADMILRAVR